MRRPLRFRRSGRGIALVALLAVVTTGVLFYLVAAVSPQAFEAYRNRKTEEALSHARDALIGSALQYRDQQMALGTNNAMYGYLPLPDMGSHSNHNVSCTGEGCDAINFTGNTTGTTAIGRFPWRVLGVEPIRDGHGECLWMLVSGSHQRIWQSTPMNWDSIGHVDVAVANGSNALVSVLQSVHERPVVVIFSPGAPLANQHRDASSVDDVTECGGNYDVENYLDPDTLGALNGISNYFGPPATPGDNNAFGDTSASAKVVSPKGDIFRRNDGTLWPSACPTGSTCTLASNDVGLEVTPDILFGALRKGTHFRTDINTMLDRMVSCLQDQIASGGTLVPAAIDGYAPPVDKTAGRIPNSTCYGDGVAPAGYFTNWRDMVFVARPVSGTFNVTVDAVPQSCNAVVIFSGQRGTKSPVPSDPGESAVQLRNAESVSGGNSRLNVNWLANYLEGINLAHFTGAGTDFLGSGYFDAVSSSQSAEQDIVRCVPTSATLTASSPQNLTDSSGNALSPLAGYDATTRTITLGSENATTSNGVPGGVLYGCAWTSEANARGNGFRAYFSFRFMGLTGGVGNNGFVFTAADGESNSTAVCGEAGTHLAYSGDNGVTAPVAAPKIGIEFDQSRNAGAINNTLASGRNDPCGTTGCGGTVGYNSHSAIVYWGNSAVAYDDNAHGYPPTGSQTANPRPDPQNPDNVTASPPGIAFVDYRAHEDANGDAVLDSYLYHVRVEVVPTRHVNATAAELSNTSFATRVWIVRDSATNAQVIGAMQNTTRPMAALSPTGPTLSDTATAYDVAGAACNADGSCGAAGYTCGTDNICYRPGLRTVRLGFTNSQRTQDQRVIISNLFTSWIP